MIEEEHIQKGKKIKEKKEGKKENDKTTYYTARGKK